MRSHVLPVVFGLLGTAGISAASTAVPLTPDDDNRIDANRIDMRLTNLGSFGWDRNGTGNGDLIYPAGSGLHAIFAGGIFVAGRVGGELRVSGAEYAFTFAPGTIEGGEPSDDEPRFRVYELDENSGLGDTDFDEWPSGDGAPTDGTGRPLLLGSETHWSVYNDAQPSSRSDVQFATETPLGLEVRQTSWSYAYPGALDNTVFLRYELTNATESPIEDVCFTMFTDPDIGSARGVLGGCDPGLDLGYAYKEAGFEDPSYGLAAPAVGFRFLETPEDGSSLPIGMSAYVSYINGTDPGSPEQAYDYMRGFDFDGSAVVDPTTEEETSFWYSGDPLAGTGWLDNNGVNRKVMVSTGPFSMEAAETETVVVALILGQGTEHIDGVRVLKEHAEEIADRWSSDDFPGLVAVHPGDLDADGDVDAEDLIPLAMSFGETGPVRRGASLGWESQGVLQWPTPGAASADATGDGVVDMADLFAIGLNWGKVHVVPPGTPRPPEVDLSLYADRLGEILEAIGDGTSEFARAAHALIDPVVSSAGTPPVTFLDASPNPFRRDVTFVYRLGTEQDVRTSIVDPAGRRIYTAPPRRLGDGTYTESWNGRDQYGAAVAAGVYFFVLDTEQGRLATRLVRVR